MIIQTDLILENMHCKGVPWFSRASWAKGHGKTEWWGLPSSFLSCQFEIFRALASLPNLYTQYGNTGSIWEGKLWMKETENASVFLGTGSKFSEKNKSLKDMHWGWTANRRWEMTCPKMWLQQLGEQNTAFFTSNTTSCEVEVGQISWRLHSSSFLRAYLDLCLKGKAGTCALLP